MSSTLNVVIDLSHHNAPVDFFRAKQAGILGVIHKASQGLMEIDPQYMPRRTVAGRLNLLWGAYHFGDDSDGESQAKHFLTARRDAPLLVLDLEENPRGGSMSLDQARLFVSTVKDVTGTWPGIYGGWYLQQMLGGQKDEVLGNCWLWVADYRAEEQPTIPETWGGWKLWQYTDGQHGHPPLDIAGIAECDRDIFNGPDANALQAFWTGAPGAS